MVGDNFCHSFAGYVAAVSFGGSVLATPEISLFLSIQYKPALCGSEPIRSFLPQADWFLGFWRMSVRSAENACIIILRFAMHGFAMRLARALRHLCRISSSTNCVLVLYEHPENSPTLPN